MPEILVACSMILPLVVFELDTFFQAFQEWQQRGLTWAPSQPSISEECFGKGHHHETLFFPNDGSRSNLGIFRHEGLSAWWYTVEFPCGKRPGFKHFAGSGNDTPSITTCILLHALRVRLLDDYSWGAIVRPIRDSERHIRNVPDRTMVQNQDDVNGLLVAVLGSNEQERRRWTWKAIHQWKRAYLRYFPAQMETAKKILIE